MRYNRGLLVLCAAVAIAVTLHGCGAKETMPEETQRQTEETQIRPVTSAPAAEASPEGEPLKTGNVHLTVSRLALAYPGRTEDIYCGTAPREEIVWASGAPCQREKQKLLRSTETNRPAVRSFAWQRAWRLGRPWTIAHLARACGSRPCRQRDHAPILMMPALWETP